MAEKTWSPEFIKYMNDIVNHPNYKGIPFKRKSDGGIQWLAPKTGDIGKKRKKWAEDKAKKLGIKIEAGVYAKVMFRIHPTKEKPCQICGRRMSLRYIYLNASLVKSLNKTFGIKASHTDTISEAYEKIVASGITTSDALTFFNKKFGTGAAGAKQFFNLAENKCSSGETNLLGPGAMSNFPDRYDGFHSYNRCCRVKEDKGRHADNMKTYNKDRRAYEYWSDGNIHAANKFMKSNVFKGTTVDHICPISLGFIHDSIQLQPMAGGDNSAKRDRLDADSVKKLIKIEKSSGKPCVSWFSGIIWENIKDEIRGGRGDFEKYRDLLKQNMVNFMNALHFIITNSEKGRAFLSEKLLKPHYDDFNYDYSFDAAGNIIKRTQRRITDATRKEIERYERVSFDAVADFLEKSNREIKPTISKAQYGKLRKIIELADNSRFNDALDLLRDVVADMQNTLLSE